MLDCWRFMDAADNMRELSCLPGHLDCLPSLSGTAKETSHGGSHARRQGGFDRRRCQESLLEISEAEYDTMFDINSKSAFFFLKEAGRVLEDHGKIVTLVTSLLGAFTSYYSTYAGGKAPV